MSKTYSVYDLVEGYTKEASATAVHDTAAQEQEVDLDKLAELNRECASQLRKIASAGLVGGLTFEQLRSKMPGSGADSVETVRALQAVEGSRENALASKLQNSSGLPMERVTQKFSGETIESIKRRLAGMKAGHNRVTTNS